MIAARQIYLGRGGAKLPYDAEVEWLLSDGSQYINTGIGKPGVGAITYWEAEAGFDSSYSAVRKFAAGYEYPNQMYYCEFNNSQFGAVGWNVRYFCNATLAGRTLYKVSMLLDGRTASFSVIVGNETITENASPPSQQDIAINLKFMLFCMSPIYNGPGVMIGRNKLWLNGNLTRDYAPIRFTNELGQSEGALYDRANPTVGMNRDGTPRNDGLYLNRGTGAFQIGPDKQGDFTWQIQPTTATTH